ncbi:MAG: hypothetical protein JW738_01490 [Actinobacteria bacterium]|nr:hypothetical protein [Actinomycetota bacterium]
MSRDQFGMLKNPGVKIRAFFTLRSLSREPLVFSVYAIVISFMTYPAITLVSRTYAEPKDPLGVLWWFWWLKYSFFSRISVSPVSIAGVPSGLDISPYKIDPLFNLLARILSIISTETIAYNIILLFSFFLTAVFTYYLVRYLTGNIYAAAFSGFVLGFCPFMLVQGKEHLGLIAVFWIPLFFLLLIKTWTQRSLGNLIGCSAVFVLMTLYNYQYGLIVGVCSLFFALILWLSGRPWKKRSRDTTGLLRALSFVIAVVIIIAVLFTVFAGSPIGAGKDISEVYKYSARPWDYLVPHAEGSALGHLTRSFIESSLHGSFLAENSLFLGYVPLFLAILAVINAFAGFVGRKEIRSSGDVGRPHRNIEPTGVTAKEEKTRAISPDRLIFSFAACGLFAFIVSMPPSFSLFGHRIYMPSCLLHQLVPQFRAYARFGMITIFCVAVLCGYAVSKIAGVDVPGKWKPLALTVVSVLVLFEFAIVPPFRSLKTKETTGYCRWLAAQPGEPVVAIYPLFYGDSFYCYSYLFQQRTHKKPMVNGAKPGTTQDCYRQSIMDITNMNTPALLRELDTKYVLVLPELYGLPLGWDWNFPFSSSFDVKKIPQGLEKIKEIDSCSIYEVTAERPDLIPLYGKGFYPAYIDREGRFWHPAIGTSVITIESRYDGPSTCRLRFKARCPQKASIVRINVNEKEVAARKVTKYSEEIVVEELLIRPGLNEVRLVSDGELYCLTGIKGYQEVKAALLVSDTTLETVK